MLIENNIDEVDLDVFKVSLRVYIVVDDMQVKIIVF
jgi:hypothetical protein